MKANIFLLSLVALIMIIVLITSTNLNLLIIAAFAAIAAIGLTVIAWMAAGAQWVDEQNRPIQKPRPF